MDALVMLQLTKEKSHILPKRGHQPDKYEGQVDPLTKLRHGRGQYQFSNAFFKYDGEYIQGKKQGQGSLKLKDGTVIKGTFRQDQLVGPAQIFYSHGGYYQGNLSLGEKDGKGVYKSSFQEYDGEWINNSRQGKGSYLNKSTGQKYKGDWQKNKFHGIGTLNRWNYSYEGQFANGLKEGEGKEINEWPREGEIGVGKYQYRGKFVQNQFQGNGEFLSKQSQYVYKGDFSKGKPILYPNQLRLWISTNTKAGEVSNEGEKSLINLTQPIQYELEGDSINFYVQPVYQGPQALDQIQPTQEEIDTMIKNWQNQNKKNKNPPPMPDFTQPRMKKPDVALVNQENGRTIVLRLSKETQGKEDFMKIDYRSEIIVKRKQNEETRLEALKKAEQDAGKKGGKKDNKQLQLKVNLYKQKPNKKQTSLNIFTQEGKAELKDFQLPDDFPPGKYYITFSSPCVDFGSIINLRKELNVKAKAAVKKK